MKEIILAGNPNCGKTTLFNTLTKSREATGNRSGVTVNVKSARAEKKYGDIKITDLPGMYSIASLEEDELRAAKYINSANYATIIYVADATNMEKSLFLLTEILEKSRCVVLALNMYDEVIRENINIDIDGISSELGISVIPISASKGRGIEKLIGAALDVKQRRDLATFSSDDERVAFISNICSWFVHGGDRSNISDRIDKLICRPCFGIPLFLIVISAVFFVSFSSLGAFLSSCVSSAVSAINEHIKFALGAANCSDICIGILCDGIFGGISAVSSFLPQTALLFMLLELMEDVGYLSRAEFIMDPIMRRFGLSGKAFIPLFLGVGCAVPAIQSAAVLDRSERKRIISAVPFVPCSARFAVLSGICTATFEKHAWLAITVFYFLGMAVALICASISKSKSPLIIELPKFRAPSVRNILTCAKSKMTDLFTRTISIVTLSSVIIYALFTIDPGFNITNNVDKSLLCLIGKKLVFILSPIGIADHRIAAALISGFFAKETIISSMAILGVGNIGIKTAICLCTFSLLYTPCAATMGAIKKESGAMLAFYIATKTFFTAYIITCALNIILTILL